MNLIFYIYINSEENIFPDFLFSIHIYTGIKYTVFVEVLLKIILNCLRKCKSIKCVFNLF